MKIHSLFFFVFGIFQIQGFIFPPQKYRKLRIFEPEHSSPKETNCILFFTGGSNAISPSIYSDFFKSCNEKNIAVYIPCFQYKHVACLIRILHNKYKKVIAIGHSSGCTTLLNQIQNQEYIQDVVLMDPVNTNIFKKETFSIPYVKTLFFIHAAKSYKINHDPYGLPFIPFLKINKHQLDGQNISRIIEITETNYGHSDILNPIFSNIMHFTRITVGNKNRTNAQLYGYHEQLSETILYFMEEEKTHCPTSLPQNIWDE